MHDSKQRHSLVLGIEVLLCYYGESCTQHAEVLTWSKLVEVDEAETHDEIEGHDSEVSMAEVLLKDLEQVLSEVS